MPVKFNIKEESFEFPEGWQDVSLDKYMLYLEHVEKTTPKLLREVQLAPDDEARKEALDKITEHYYKTEIMPFFVRYVCFYTGMPKDTAEKLKPDLIETMYRQIELNLAASLKGLDGYTPTITHAGKLWYLPEKYMTNSTVIEFFEAAQFEHYAKQVAGNQFKALPDLLAVLLKSDPDERYDDKRRGERRKIFGSMTMLNVWRVCFFLQRLNERFQKDFLTFTAVVSAPSPKKQE